MSSGFNADVRLIEAFSTIDEELQVVQSSRRLVERFSGVRAVANETENEAMARSCTTTYRSCPSSDV